MATNQASMARRQRERARQQRRREKMAKRLERREQKKAAALESEEKGPEIDWEAMVRPTPLDPEEEVAAVPEAQG